MVTISQPAKRLRNEGSYFSLVFILVLESMGCYVGMPIFLGWNLMD